MPSSLTAEQLEQFQRDGYLVLPSIFSPDEVARMRTEADFILELILNSSVCHQRRSGRLDWLQRPGGSGGDQMVRKIQPINDLSLYLTQVSEDPRFLGPLQTVMGDEPRLMEEKLNYKEPLPEPVEGIEIPERDDGFPIHNDWAYYKAQSYPQSILSSAICMDDVREDSGPLRIWPGSHKQHLEHEPCGYGLQVKEGLIDFEGGQSVLAPAGSIMIFHVLLVHNSRPNTSGKPRRLMIYSHHPASHPMPPDIRNGPARLREHPWELEYLRKKMAGEFEDVFTAPSWPGYENAEKSGKAVGAKETTSSAPR